MPPAFAPPTPFGDQEYTELRERLVRAVRRVCPRWLAADAEDMVQEVLIKLMRREQSRPDSPGPEEGVSEGSAEKNEEKPAFSQSYLMKAAYHQVVDEIRRRRVRREVALESDKGDPPSYPDRRPGPSEEDHRRRLGRAIRKCMENLLDSRRRAVALYLRGYRAKEAAKLLSWEVKRTENLIYRGREDLQTCLREAGFSRVE